MNLAQYGTFDDGTVNLIGGETYSIEMPTSADGGAVGVGPHGKLALLSTLGSMLKLEARPNPTTGAATISYTLPEASRVTLSVYDVNGGLVKTLVTADQRAGEHAIVWDGASRPVGVRWPAAPTSTASRPPERHGTGRDQDRAVTTERSGRT